MQNKIDEVRARNKEITGILKCFDLKFDNADVLSYALLQMNTGLSNIESLYLDEYKYAQDIQIQENNGNIYKLNNEITKLHKQIAASNKEIMKFKKCTEQFNSSEQPDIDFIRAKHKKIFELMEAKQKATDIGNMDEIVNKLELLDK